MPALPTSPLSTLRTAAAAWFVTATLGQWAFVVFIAAFYGGLGLQGEFAALNAKPHITGWVPGDTLGNAQWLLHAGLGGLVTLAGMWQLVPALRQRWPRLHRWNGRLFLVVALLATATGFYLTWVRGSMLNLPSALSTSANGVLIVVFGALAWRAARRRDFADHRRHALRAYLLVNGVWFLRIGIVPAGLLGNLFGLEMGYDSAVFLAASYASWLLPLACLQLYLHAERSPRPGLQYAVAALFLVLALATLGGSATAVAFLWWPYL